MERQSMQRLVTLSILAVLFGALSIFADDRPGWRTDRNDRGDRGYSDRGYNGRDLVGTVTRVAGDGDDFWLRTNRGEVKVEAKGGVRVHYRGRQYRIRDLDRGDYVAVNLQSNSRNRYRASSVEVIRSASETYGRGGRYDDRYYDRGGRYARIEGQVVSLDTRRDLLILRTRSRGDVAVNVNELERRYGRNWARNLRRGEWVTVEGYANGRTFVAIDVQSNRGGWGGYGR